jgi:hypothetical protein
MTCAMAQARSGLSADDQFKELEPEGAIAGRP